jgi:hypothetical protein
MLDLSDVRSQFIEQISDVLVRFAHYEDTRIYGRPKSTGELQIVCDRDFTGSREKEKEAN